MDSKTIFVLAVLGIYLVANVHAAVYEYDYGGGGAAPLDYGGDKNKNAANKNAHQEMTQREIRKKRLRDRIRERNLGGKRPWWKVALKALGRFG